MQPARQDPKKHVACPRACLSDTAPILRRPCALPFPPSTLPTRTRQVSSKIREGKGWEAAELNEILWALRQPIPAAARAAARAEAAAAAYLATTAATDGLIQLPPALRRAAASSAADGAAALYVDAAAARSGSGGGAGGGRRQLHEEPAAASGDAATASTTAPQVGVTTDAATDAAKPLPSPPPLFVDVGANVGWFSINAAAAGFRCASASAIRHVRRDTCNADGRRCRHRRCTCHAGRTCAWPTHAAAPPRRHV